MSYQTLMQQLDRIHRHARQGSILTRRRYHDAMRRFLHYVSEIYKLQKIANVNSKHLKSYVEYLKEQGRKPGYIVTELAGIRYYCNQIPGRHNLTSDNAKLGVSKRQRVGDRAWNKEELADIVQAAVRKGKTWLADVLIIAAEVGQRIHEVIRLYRSDAERALKTCELTIKGKGGLVRRVPLG